jgi:hypothetical protein
MHITLYKYSIKQLAQSIVICSACESADGAGGYAGSRTVYHIAYASEVLFELPASGKKLFSDKKLFEFFGH